MGFLTNIFPTAGTEKIILPAGDSITVGFTNDPTDTPYVPGGIPSGFIYNGGYRLIMQQVALSENKQIKMMGQQTLNSIGMSSPWHEGVSGQYSTQIQARIDALPATPVPDVVVLYACTNDFYYTQVAVPPVGFPPISGVRARHTLIMDAIFSKFPATKVVVATLPQWFNPTGCTGCDGERFAAASAMPERGTFNTYIAGLPVNYSGGTRFNDIKVADLAAVFPNTLFYGDGLHPNRAGYRRLAIALWTQVKLWM